MQVAFFGSVATFVSRMNHQKAFYCLSFYIFFVYTGIFLYTTKGVLVFFTPYFNNIEIVDFDIDKLFPY